MRHTDFQLEIVRQVRSHLLNNSIKVSDLLEYSQRVEKPTDASEIVIEVMVGGERFWVVLNRRHDKRAKHLIAS